MENKVGTGDGPPSRGARVPLLEACGLRKSFSSARLVLRLAGRVVRCHLHPLPD